MKRRVVVTGIGPIAATGIGKEEFFNNLLGMHTCISEVPKEWEENYRFKSRFFVPKPNFALKDFGIHPAVENMMEEISRFSVLCTKLALEDAKFDIKEGDKYFRVKDLENCSIILGVGMSSLQTAFDSYTAHIGKGNRFNRMVIPMLMPNSASAWISILFGIKGLNYTLNASCASGTLAIGEAYRNIIEGRSEVVITGGVEALGERNGAVMRGFDVMTTLTRSQDGKPRPFSKERSGFLFNEGAGCVLILEELQSALQRGANIYAEILGYESSSDAYNIVQMDPSGENIAELLRRMTKDIKVDYINAHGTATVLNDEVEAKVIQSVFGEQTIQPYINSTKGILGHSIEASGALEAAVMAWSIKNQKIHGNLITDPIENLNLPLNTLDAEIEYALSTSYGFGGHNGMLLFKRYDEDE